MRYVRTETQAPITPSPSPVPSTRTATSREIVPMLSDGTAISPGAAIGPSGTTPGAVAPIASGGLIGRAVQGGSGRVQVELIDGIMSGNGERSDTSG